MMECGGEVRSVQGQVRMDNFGEARADYTVEGVRIEQRRPTLQVRAFLFKTGSHLFARCAMDTRVSHAAFPVTKKEVLLGQGLEATPLERVGANVSHSPLYLTFMLRHPGATRHHVHAVVPAKVG